MISLQIKVGDYVLYRYYSPTKDGESVDRKHFNKLTNSDMNLTSRRGIFKVVEILDAGVAYPEEVIFKWYQPEDKEADAKIRKSFVDKKSIVPRMVLDKGTSMEVVPLSFKYSSWFGILDIYRYKKHADKSASQFSEAFKLCLGPKVKYVP